MKIYIGVISIFNDNLGTTLLIGMTLRLEIYQNRNGKAQISQGRSHDLELGPNHGNSIPQKKTSV